METKDIFERMAARYDTEERVQVANRIAGELRGVLTGTEEKQALDYCCGTGLVGLQLAGLFKSMLLADTSPQMVEQVRQKIAKAGLANVKVRCWDIMQEDAAPITADIILLSQVLLHVKAYPLLLRRLYAALNPAGRLLIVDFDKNERIVSDMVHNGFAQPELSGLLGQIGFASAVSHTFYHGEKIFMNQDASLFLMDAKK